MSKRNKMDWKPIILIVALGVISSCKKFEHETFSIPNCELCTYAETLEGTYRGYAFGYTIPGGDSLTITVSTQLFQGNSQYEDSTFTNLSVFYNFDCGLLEHDIVRVLNADGDCEANMVAIFGESPTYSSDSPLSYFKFTSDSLKISYTNYFAGSTSPIPINFITANLEKQ